MIVKICYRLNVQLILSNTNISRDSSFLLTIIWLYVEMNGSYNIILYSLNIYDITYNYLLAMETETT